MQTMERLVEPELLDELSPADPRAVRSRQDLVRVNAWMGHGRIMAGELGAAYNGRTASCVLEMGAGDGRFLLGMARRLPASWRGTRALLLDRVTIVAEKTRQGFAALGWQLDSAQADALDWLERSSSPECPVVLVNLFLHHLSEAQLTRLFRAAARKTERFIALEPRRCRLGLFFSRQLWLIGCNGVTRHDARVSVRAGFTGSELSRLWTGGEDWDLEERRAGRFSHLFVASRKR
jgi:hypothetical protein